MTEKLSPFREAMLEYRGNVSTIAVRNIVPEGLEGLFKGSVVVNNALFKKDDLITFRYYSVPESVGVFTPGIEAKYPIISGLAYIDGSAFQKKAQ